MANMQRRFNPSLSASLINDTPRESLLSKSQSNMRLSLSLEGKAELVSSQHSPIRQPLHRVASLSALRDARPTSLRRASSDTAGITLPPISSWPTPPPPPPRLGRGRSRDVHAWESCADADTRDELTAHAEQESKGSAIAEISLLRSTHALQPSSTKRNAPLSLTNTGGNAPRQVKRTKLSRVSSSAARLETRNLDEVDKQNDVKSKMDFAVLLSPTDSDKENWSPVGEGNARQRRPLPGAPQGKSQKTAARRRPGTVLGAHKSGAPTLGRAKTAPSARHRPCEAAGTGVDIFEDGDNPEEGEVDKFMAPQVSPSKKGDVDCAVGLLSLSKGAWR